MSYEADLLNAYRNQLAKIRAALEAVEFEECYAVHGFDELERAISSTEADEVENRYRPQVLPSAPPLPQSSEWNKENGGLFYTWMLDDDAPEGEEK
jgi:hypothetical protein